MVGLRGFEPRNSRLSGGRSNQLSYRPDNPQDPAVGTPGHSACQGHAEQTLESTTRGVLRMFIRKSPRKRGGERERVTQFTGRVPMSSTWFTTVRWIPGRLTFPVRKEVIQPQVPLRLPCYDLVPITEFAFGAVPPKVGQSDFERPPLSWLDGRCVQGSGTYSPRHG